MIEGNFTDDHDDPIHPYQNTQSIDLRFFLVRIFYPCLLIWGTIGNGLCLRVLLSKKFFKNSTCQYLAVLAVIDILFIWMRSSKHIYKLFRKELIFNTAQWVCSTLTFSSSALAHMASWILVIVSFDRYLIVTSRYRRRGSAVSRVFYSTSILIAIVALCNLYYFFMIGYTVRVKVHVPTPQPHLSNDETDVYNTSLNETDDIIEPGQSMFVCMPTAPFQTFFRTYIPVFDILFVAVIPFFLLCFTNIGIITYTMRANRQMRQHRKRSHRRHQRLTIMLLSVTLAFIGLTCPSVIYICVNKIFVNIPSKENLTNFNKTAFTKHVFNIQVLVDLSEALWYTKHSMNFILYTLSGQDFRREFMKLFTQGFGTRSFIVKKLNHQTQTTSLQTIDSASLEMSMIRNSNRKKPKKSMTKNREPLSNNPITPQPITLTSERI